MPIAMVTFIVFGGRWQSGPVASFGRAPCKRLSGYGVARPYRRGLRVLYGFSIRHLSFGYCYQGGGLGWCRDLRGGSLFRKLVDPTAVESSGTPSAAYGINWGQTGLAPLFSPYVECRRSDRRNRVCCLHFKKCPHISDYAGHLTAGNG